MSKIDSLKLLIEADAPAWYKNKDDVIWMTEEEYKVWRDKQVPGTKVEKDIIDPKSGEIYFEAGEVIPELKKKEIEPFDTDDDEEPIKRGLTDKEYWDMLDDFKGQAEEIEYDGMGTWEDAVGDIADSIIRFGHHGSGRFYKPEDIQSYLGYKKSDVYSKMGALGRLTDDIYDAGKRKQNNEDVAGPGVNAMGTAPTPTASYKGKKFRLKKRGNKEGKMSKIERLFSVIEDL